MITCSNKGTGSGAGSTGTADAGGSTGAAGSCGTAGAGGTADAGGTAGAAAGMDERTFGVICSFGSTAATDDSMGRSGKAPPATAG